MRVAVAMVLVGLLAGAYTPPALHGHVVDTTASLSADDVRDLDLTIDAMGNRGGFALVVLITDTGLGGETIEDIAYTAFNTWGVGEHGKDNGVLLVISPKDRRVRIETGKGVGGALPDLKTNDIIRQRIAPYLQQGQVRTAIEDGAIAISDALAADDSWRRSATTQTQQGPSQDRGTTSSGVNWQLIVGGAVALIVLTMLSRRRFGLGGGGGGSWWGGGGFGGGGSGSGYSGGGGHSGGGGSSDSF